MYRSLKSTMEGIFMSKKIIISLLLILLLATSFNAFANSSHWSHNGAFHSFSGMSYASPGDFFNPDDFCFSKTNCTASSSSTTIGVQASMKYTLGGTSHTAYGPTDSSEVTSGEWVQSICNEVGISSAVKACGWHYGIDVNRRSGNSYEDF